MRTLALSVLAACLSVAAAGVSATVIYGTTAIGESPRTSDYGTASGSGWRTFDNFTFGSNASIERVSWRGLWFADLTPAPAPTPVVDTWEVAFYASTGGIPGAALWTQNISAASVAQTFRGNGVLSLGQNTNYNASYYDYVLDLPAIFNIAADTEYWISVTAVAANFNPAFAILGATGGDDSSYQQLLGANMSVSQTFVRARDRAFVIEGTVPEPGTLALGGIALAAMAGIGVRRRSKAA